ncbi:hypothetical protein SBV1_2280020 [Verrucomicrobia bacterium]|nr:hypothetical protein SBV1_2280020 [Verrucomicrobiota bacterium]
MRILLRHKDTGEYYRTENQWTSQAGEARDFESSAAALGFCVEARLREVEILLAFDDARYNIRLPLHTGPDG